MMPAPPPALNPKSLEMKYALARLTAQKSRDSPTCGSALRPTLEKLWAGFVPYRQEEQNKERPLQRWRRLNTELTDGHASQKHANNSIRLERPNTKSGNGLSEPKGEKKGNLGVVL